MDQQPYSNQSPEQLPYAAPPGSPNPYAAPVGNFDYEPIETYTEQGNYALGFVVGFLFSLLGLIIMYVAGADLTKKGALHGFLGRLGLTILIVLSMAVFG